MELAVACERFGAGFWGQPASAATSLAFVAAAVAILAGYRADLPAGYRADLPTGRRATYGLLVAAVGVGSLVQHGPHPPWQAYAHDLPLAAVLAYLAVDAAADLTGRRRSAGWWAVPTVAMLPVVASGPVASTVAQGALASVAIGLNLLRAWRRPRLRRVLVTALALLGAGALAGTLGDRTALCQPDGLVQGHAVWHLMAAAALWRLAPVVGVRETAVPG